MNQPPPAGQSPLGGAAPVAPKQPAVAPWLLITAIIVLLGGGGYLIWNYLGQQKTQPSETTETAVPEEAIETPTEPTTEPTDTTATADWKTYTNEAYGYSIKYPTNWEIKELSGLKDANGQAYLSSIGYRPNTLKEDVVGGIFVTNIKIADVIAAQKKAFESNSTFKNQSTAKIGTIDATTLSFQNNTDTTIQPIIYLIEKNNKVYIITGEGNASTKTDTTNINKIAKQILFTFQFSP